MIGAGPIFASRLRGLLEEHDEKQVDLARLLNVTEATVSRYLKGRIPDDIQTLMTIANHYEVTVDYLIGYAKQPKGQPSRREDISSVKRLNSLPLIRFGQGVDNMQMIQLEVLPVIGRIRAGVPLLSDEHVIAHIEVPTRISHQADFALEVSGDSMEGAGLQPGDYVFMRLSSKRPPIHGDIVAAMIDQGEMTLKRYVRRDGHYWLHPENLAYPDIPVDARVSIQGVYVGRFSEFRGNVDPPAEELTEDELVTKLAKMRQLDPDTVAGMLDVLSKRKR